MTTAQQRLDSVRAEIDEVLRKGQRLRKGDREVQRAELASLRMLEEQYARQAAREASNSKPRSRISRLYHGGKGI
ncbi:hypothetical protein U8L64_10185 [Pseudomonas sp. FIP_A4]|uniref:hypothetical protein n=1 Tax=Pseudomonas sp. FIP_A4 TaxID=3070684 RepID=UPI002FD74495